MSERQFNPHFPFGSAEEREEANRRVATIGAELKTRADAMAEAFRPIVERSVEGLRAIVAATNHGEQEQA